MKEDDQFRKKNGQDSLSKEFFKFVEKGFDWIVLVVITLIILFVLVFFSV